MSAPAGNDGGARVVVDVGDDHVGVVQFHRPPQIGRAHV